MCFARAVVVLTLHDDASMPRVAARRCDSEDAGGRDGSVRLVRFRMLLALMGTLLVNASRFKQALQRQIWLHRVIEIGSDDGVVYHYTFQNRRIRCRRGPADNASCSVRFATARQGFRALTSSHRFELMMEGLHN